MSRKPLKSQALAPARVSLLSRTAQRWLIGLTTAGFFAAAGIGGFILAGGPEWVRNQASQASARAGFSIAKVEIHGMQYTSSLDVHTVLTAQQGAILFANIADIKAGIEKISWVEQANVERQLPDRLVIRLKERTPFAIWQRRGELNVIDRAGVTLTRARLDRFAALPIVVGENAHLHAAQLFADLAVSDNLRGQLDSAVWVGNRRWNIKFRSGEVLMLPEGEKMQKLALSAFSQLQSGYHLLGRGEAHFDMRLGDRLFVGRVNAERADKSPPQPAETSI